MNDQQISKYEQRKQNRERRDQSINDEFKRLYNEERIRYDDCVKIIADKFFLCERSVTNILFKKK